jgi:hypothetical protein
MIHQALTLNHRLESWVFVNATARNAAGTYVAADVGRIAFTNDSADYWRLLTVTPTWKRLNGVYASYQTVTPVGSATTAALTPGVMVGLNAPITPTVTGKILVTISGTLINTVANKTPNIQIRYGTGTPPVFGVAATGTVTGGICTMTGNTINNASPFSLSAIVLNAALATALWFDLAIWNSTTGGTAWVTGTVVTAVELP